MFISGTKGTESGLPTQSNRVGRYSRSIARLLIFTVILTGTTPILNAQFYEYGQNAGSIKWNQLSSEHFRLIYPRGIDSLAMGVADRLEYYYPYLAKSEDRQVESMPVIIHNESSFSNGVFVWAPRRLEIFTNPEPNGYPQDWLTQLALHEGRHAFQVSRLNQGLTRGLSFVAGEQALGAVVGYLPLWYLEGDAVDAETRFSRTGRGRMPSFEMGMKALVLEKKRRYSFSKALLGSYKDYVPNHYQMGYLMVRYGRRTFGDGVWRDMEKYVARNPYAAIPTYISNRKYGIRSKNYLYNSTLNMYASHWASTLEKRSRTAYQDLTPGISKHYTSYRFPHFVNDSVLVVLKSGRDQIPEVIRLDREGNEERLFQPGYSNSGRISHAHGKIVWDEWIPDWRWSNRNFSGIRLFEMSTGEIKNLGSRTRYYAPALSSDGTRIAAIEQLTDHTFRLVILDLDGSVLQALNSPGDRFIQHPAWMSGDSGLVVTMNTDTGEALYHVSPVSGSWKLLFESGFDDISFPSVHNDRIYFSCTYSGIDNIYVYQMSEGTVMRVTSSDFGAFDPAVSADGKKLTYSDYHADGYHLAVASLTPSAWESLDEVTEHDEQIDSESTAHELSVINGAADMSKGEYEVKPYNKFLNSINIHSWLPLWFDYLNPELALSLEDFPLKPGFTVVSQNLLSTVVGQVGYEYSDQTHYLHSGVVLKGKVPVVELSMQYGGDPLVYVEDENLLPDNPGNRMVFRANSYVPVRFNTGKMITRLQPQVSWVYVSDLFPDAGATGVDRGSQRMLYRLYFSTFLRRGIKDIWPRWGITSSLTYQHAPFDRVNLGNMSAFSSNVYLPGLLKHQSVKVNYAVQYQQPERFYFSNLMPMARGMGPVNAEWLSRWSLDYTAPLLYPDLSIEPLLFIKRIRVNGWMDYMSARDAQVSDPEPGLADRQYLTAGLDLVADLHLLRTSFPISAGSRLIYLPETRSWSAEVLLNVSVR